MWNLIKRICIEMGYLYGSKKALLNTCVHISYVVDIDIIS